VPKKSPSGHQTAGFDWPSHVIRKASFRRPVIFVLPVGELRFDPQRGDRPGAVDLRHAGRLAGRHGDRLGERLLAGPLWGRIAAEPLGEEAVDAFQRLGILAANAALNVGTVVPCGYVA